MSGPYLQGVSWAFLAANAANLDPGEHAVLATIMAHYNRTDGQAFLLATTISTKSGVRHTKVFTSLKALQERGILVVENRGKRSNMYRAPAFSRWLEAHTPNEIEFVKRTIEEVLSYVERTRDVRQTYSTSTPDVRITKRPELRVVN